MSELPGDSVVHREHEWLRREEDGSVTIGITDHAQVALGDLVYVELPEVGQESSRAATWRLSNPSRRHPMCMHRLPAQCCRQRRAGGRPGENQRRPLRRRLDRAHAAQRAIDESELMSPDAYQHCLMKTTPEKTMPFIPHTEEDTREMLAAIGARALTTCSTRSRGAADRLARRRTRRADRDGRSRA